MLIRSIGMEPSHFDRRLKLLFLIRLYNLLNNHVSCDAGIGLVVAIYSALMRQPVQPGLVVLGDLSIQGNIKAVRSLAEPLQIGMDNGARCALIPILKIRGTSWRSRRISWRRLIQSFMVNPSLRRGRHWV